MITAEKTHPRLEKPIAELHQLLRGLFYAEASLMRGYAYWGPVGTVFEEKLAASSLSYLHMRNADDAIKLMEFLLLHRPNDVFDPKASQRTVAMANAPTFRHVIDDPATEQPAETSNALDAMLRASHLYDYHIVEAGQAIAERYERRIEPVRSNLRTHNRDTSTWLA